MNLTGDYDHATLLWMGAQVVRDIHDEDGNIVGVEVEPDIDAKGYAAALKSCTAARGLADLRSRRDAALGACDWTQMADSPLSPERQASWATYRQALRDLPAQKSPEWPTQPT